MKHFTYTIAAILLVALTSATTVSIMTVRPATPTDVAVVVGNPEALKASILNLTKRGYVVKCAIPTAVGGNSGTGIYQPALVVLEKY